MTVSLTSLNIGHTSWIPSTRCFCASAETPSATGHEYMQMCQPHYASDLPLLQTVTFNGPFAIELHHVLMCDWQFWYLDCVNYCSDRLAAQPSHYPGCQLLIPLILHCWHSERNLMSFTVKPNRGFWLWSEKCNFSSSEEFMSTCKKGHRAGFCVSEVEVRTKSCCIFSTLLKQKFLSLVFVYSGASVETPPVITHSQYINTS